MKALRILTFALLPLVLLAAGCSSPEARLVGDWEGKLIVNDSAIAPPADNPFAAAVGAAMKAGMQNMVGDLRPKYQFRSDKTFDFILASPLGTAQSNGTWEVVSSEGDNMTVRLNPTNNTTFERSITFTDPEHFQLQDEHGTLQFTRIKK